MQHIIFFFNQFIQVAEGKITATDAFDTYPVTVQYGDFGTKTLSIPFVNSVPFSGEAFEEVKEKSGEEKYNIKLTLSFVDTKFVELGIITENGKHCFTKGV